MMHNLTPLSPLRFRFLFVLLLLLSTTSCDPEDFLTLNVDVTSSVNTLSDTPDANPGDDICADADGNCSLRAAIEEANSGQKVYTIVLPAGTFSIQSQLDIRTGILTLKGAGTDQTTITSEGNSLIFYIDLQAGKTITLVTFEDVKVSGGSNDSFSGSTNGGGGAFHIREDAGVVMNRVLISDNRARFHGAAIYNQGRLEINDCIIRENATTLRDGGAIFNTSGGTLNLRNSAVYNNTAADDNPGSSRHGGAIYNAGALTVSNTTFSGNHAPEGQGGAIYHASGASLTINNATLCENICRGTESGAAIFNAGSMTLRNTLVANNYLGFINGIRSDLSGTITTEGGNLISVDRDLALVGSPATADLVGTTASRIDPMTGSLTFFMGTYVHPLNAGSPAIDAGSALAPGSGGSACLTTDQAGQNRVGTCDTGAYERQ